MRSDIVWFGLEKGVGLVLVGLASTWNGFGLVPGDINIHVGVVEVWCSFQTIPRFSTIGSH
jgi:hypothetical protein